MIKSFFLLAVMIGAAIVSVAVVPEAAWAGTRVALVVGNSSYQAAPQLSNPARDATAVAKMLRDAGFDSVDLQLDIGNLDLKRAIRRFETTTDDADIAVVYYAGHGFEIGATNYLIPVDARLASDRDADDETVPLERLVSSADGARRLRLIILDACRDNPFVSTMRRERKTDTVSTGLGRVEPTSTDTLIAYAARAGSTADDGDGEHSPFTTAILRDLTVPGLDVRLAFGRIHDDVIKATGGRQEPFVYGALGGGSVSLVPPPATQHEAPLDDIKADYDLVQKIDTKRAWEVFLGTHPTGFYADQARTRIEALDRQQAQTADLKAPMPASSQPQPAPSGKETLARADEAEASEKAIAVPDSARTASAKPSASEPNSLDLVRSAEVELIRLGCFSGRPDGSLGATQSALKRYLSIEGEPTNNLTITQEMVAELSKHETRVCPLQCNSGETLQGDSCVVETTAARTKVDEDAHSQQKQTSQRPEHEQPKPKTAQDNAQSKKQAMARPSIVSAVGAHPVVGVGF